MSESESHKKRSERLQVMLDIDELKYIDSWRFMYRMPSRAAAIRALIREGLKATMDPAELKALDPSDLPEPVKSEDVSVISERLRDK